MQISGTLYKKSLNVKRMTKRLREDLRELQRDAVGAGIMEMQSVIPVLTGRAKGTWLEIAAEADVASSLDFTPNSPYHRDSTVDRSDEGPFSSEYGFQDEKDGPRFFFKVNLKYYKRWETDSSSLGRGNWQSLEVFREAYREYVTKYMKNYTGGKILDAIVRTRKTL
jgi:hypothetical protein